MVEKYDIIKVEPVVEIYGDKFYPQIAVAFYINGRDVRDIAYDVELPYAMANEEPYNAGSYAYLRPDEVFCHYQSDEKLTIYGCGCGMPACWPLDVRITKQDDSVIWSDFELCHREDWKHDGMYYIFRREQYDNEMAKIDQWKALLGKLPTKVTLFKSWYFAEKEHRNLKHLGEEDFSNWKDESADAAIPVEYLGTKVNIVEYENGYDSWGDFFDMGQVKLSNILKPGVNLPSDIAEFGYTLEYVEPYNGTYEPLDMDDDDEDDEIEAELQKIAKYENPLYCVAMFKIDENRDVKSIILSRSNEYFKCEFENIDS